MCVYSVSSEKLVNTEFVCVVPWVRRHQGGDREALGLAAAEHHEDSGRV